MSSPLTLEEMRSVLSAMPDPVFILTRTGRYAAVYGGTDERYYHDGSGLVGTRISDVIKEDKAQWFLDQIETALRERRLLINEYTLSGSDVKGLTEVGPSEPIWFEGRVQAVSFEVEGEEAVLWVASNITARKQMESRLRELSETDPLTGLFNRRRLLQALEVQRHHLTRYGRAAVVLVFDIDHFKRINDELGHQAGDDVLVKVADVCRATLRATDVVARIGGDEFVVLMPETSLAQAEPIAQRLRQTLVEQLHKMLGRQMTSAVDVTVSGGFSELQLSDLRPEDVFARADSALYEAKRGGRNRVLPR
ncbi:diguanylate cyclase [Aquabacterium sp.]|uniref:GGDEF domain-containing protein n=1 Tax=Aquabacterium sp. TaxID=1872578 RepID=UPI002E3605D9|nr:diguanylate cyclase [Aquabacterium sp.]HEX5312388.1 diguanylate cyclase [Aquabacterium sp.]